MEIRNGMKSWKTHLLSSAKHQEPIGVILLSIISNKWRTATYQADLDLDNFKLHPKRNYVISSDWRSRVQVPGPRSPGPHFFGTKGPGTKVRLFEKWKKKKGPRSAFSRTGKKVQVRGPPIWAGPGDLNVWKKKYGNRAENSQSPKKKKLLTSQKFKKPANSAFF